MSDEAPVNCPRCGRFMVEVSDDTDNPDGYKLVCRNSDHHHQASMHLQTGENE